MTQTTEVFKQWRPFIASTARKISTKYHIEYEDVESQAYILFMEAIQKNKDKKILPFPYLEKSLLPLHQYAEKQIRSRKRNVEIEQYIEQERIKVSNEERDILPDDWIKCPSFEEFQEALDRMEAKVKLSDDALKLLEYITSRCWEIDPHYLDDGKETRRPYFNSTANRMFLEFRWNNRRTKKAWDELNTWWKEGNKNSWVKEER